MNEVWYLVCAILAVLALGLLIARLYREIFFFEGIRLGDRLHIALYNAWAETYDAGKRKVQSADAPTLAAPLVERLERAGANTLEALVLDVATGTGRLSAVLLADPRFAGRVIGLDVSAGMLSKAAQKLGRFKNRSVLLHQRANPLPFPDGAFAAVSCLETVELLEDQAAHLREFLRVMQPGGTLLISRNTGEWGRRGRVCPPEQFAEQLCAAGFTAVEIRPWWQRFDLVWAAKPARAVGPPSSRPLPAPTPSL